MAPTPVTILTGFLGSGKTTLIINLIPQLPPTYKLALLKNEFGDVAIDSQLASASAISGVQELLNGCICCNLVGQLGDALETLRSEQDPDRIIIETSGSAFPATLAMEVNRISAESKGEHFILDGVISVIDVENWEGYEDTSPTARMQAQYTDFVIFNKWEAVDERRFDVCLDRLGDLELDTPWVKSDKGTVGKDVILGIDGALAQDLKSAAEAPDHDHDSKEDHQSEVEVLTVTMKASDDREAGIDLEKLEKFLQTAPKEEIYRIKAVLYATSAPKSSTDEDNGVEQDDTKGDPAKYILNWAFGRWTFTSVAHLKDKAEKSHGLSTPPTSRDNSDKESILRMTIITGRYESNKWHKRIEKEGLLALEGGAADSTNLSIEKAN